MGNVPLDLRLGAGQLNAHRARTQFNPGKWGPNGTPVPVVGWDYNTTTGDDAINKYPFSTQLRGGSYISLTLAWDRTVEFDVDGGTAGKYDIGDSFIDDCCFADLDVYLMPAGATNLSELITASSSTDTNDTLEHVFFEVPTTGNYEIWVHQFASQFGQAQDYALAWWALADMSIFDPGDYNGDQFVDAQDYTMWRGDYGDTVSPGTGANGSGNGVIDAADYVIWRNNLNAGSGSGSVASIPEPNSAILLFAAAVYLAGVIHRKKRPR